MLARASLLSLVLIATAPAFAQVPDTVLLEDLTWTELRDAIGAGTTTILVPVGGTEQNGPHMALGKHNVRVRVLAERIARALGHTLVAPVIAYVPEGRINPPTAHMRFPGTISVPEDTFERVLDAAARSFRQHGFRDVVFLGDHGSTQAGQRAVAARLNREWAGGPTRAHAIEEYYRASQMEFAHALRAKGYSEAEIGTHAGLADTALMLALDARLVRADRLRPGTGEAGDGVEGDPTRATVELGRAGADLVVTKTVEAVKRALARR
ncbi:MAG TPA: creatininase family protein [Methylomirabilota bacterium]|nr:creatininase family protein [Methylomirabilota bacterium]